MAKVAMVAKVAKMSSPCIASVGLPGMLAFGTASARLRRRDAGLECYRSGNMRQQVTEKRKNSMARLQSPVLPVLILASVVTSTPILRAQTMPELITTVEGITEYRLENGMRVLLFPDQTKDTVTVNNTIFVGSRHEGYGEAGMAHLLEHMVFKGTPTFENVPKALRDHGAGRSMNGTTWLDRTNYYETMPSSDENLEFAIRLEADRMINSLIRAEDLASEMTVVRNEFERGENSPSGVLLQRMTSAAFDWHNYGQSTIGNRADIERVPVENLREFYRRYYQPDNALVVISGSFHPPRRWLWCNSILVPFHVPRVNSMRPTRKSPRRTASGPSPYDAWEMWPWSVSPTTWWRGHIPISRPRIFWPRPWPRRLRDDFTRLLSRPSWRRA